MNTAISQEQLNRLVEDAAYIQNEAEALKYVIDQVPFQQRPPGQRSIAEELLLIDRAQLHYFRTFLEEATRNPRPAHINNFSAFEKAFDEEEKEIGDIQELLDDLSKHRAGMINMIRNISLTDWNTTVYINDQKILLFDFIQRMIQFDRTQLKKIANLVRIYSDQKHSERQLHKKKSMRNSSSNNLG